MAFGFIQYKQPRLGTEVTLLLLHIPAGGISGSTKKRKKEKVVVEIAALKSSVITRPQRS